MGVCAACGKQANYKLFLGPGTMATVCEGSPACEDNLRSYARGVGLMRGDDDDAPFIPDDRSLPSDYVISRAIEIVNVARSTNRVAAIRVVALLIDGGFESRTSGTPRLCPGCRTLEGEHDFGLTCTLRRESEAEAFAKRHMRCTLGWKNEVAWIVKSHAADCAYPNEHGPGL